MKRNRKNGMKKERIIMLASSAFVLAALTMTGLYMKNNDNEVKDDGYTLDFAAMEDSADNKMQEIARQEQLKENTTQVADNTIRNQTGNTTFGNTGAEVQEEVTEDDLDYMPLEVGSGTVEIPGLTEKADVSGTDSMLENVGMNGIDETIIDEAVADVLEEDKSKMSEKTLDEAAKDKAASAGNVVVEQVLSFAEEDGLLRPVGGDILMFYSMDKSIYFATLDQYKYNPAVIFSEVQGADVIACADAKVTDIFSNEELGYGITLDLGNGYQATYGQLGEIVVNEGDIVNAGDKLAVVAAPTMYYSVEGTNLYFKLTKDGVPVNPEGMFQ